MTWLAELFLRRYFAIVAGLALATMVQAAPADTLTFAPVLPAAVAPVALPAWMEADALATNAPAWADLAEIWRRPPDPEASPMENFTYPIEHYDNGMIKAMLHAGKATVSKKTGLTWAWKVVVDLRDPTGAPDGHIEADSLLYYSSNTTRRCYCPDAVLLVRANVAIAGTGLYWNGTLERMQILSNTVVLLPQNSKNGRKQSGLAGEPVHNAEKTSQDQPHSGGVAK